MLWKISWWMVTIVVIVFLGFIIYRALQLQVGPMGTRYP